MYHLTLRGLALSTPLQIAADISRGLLHLHSLNILHSDIKACNIMLHATTEDGEEGMVAVTAGGPSRRRYSRVVAKVADFGLSIKSKLSDPKFPPRLSAS